MTIPPDEPERRTDGVLASAGTDSSPCLPDFRLLAERANDAIIVLSPEGRHLYGNTRAAELGGCSLTEFLQLSMEDFIHPEDLAAVRESFVGARHGAWPARRFQTRVVQRNGSVVRAEFTVSPVPCGNQSALLIIAHRIFHRIDADSDSVGAQDGADLLRHEIEERRKAEDDRRRRDAILEAIVLSGEQLLGAGRPAEIMPSVLERLGRAVDVGRVILDVYEFTPEGEVIARSVGDWIDPALPRPPLPQAGGGVALIRLGLQSLVETLQRGELLRGEPDDFPEPLRGMMKSAGIRSYLGVPIQVENRLYGLLSLGDCVQRRTWVEVEVEALKAYASLSGVFLRRMETELALRRSEERYRDVAEAAREFIWETDLRGRLSYLSERVRDVLGILPSQNLGKTLFDLMPTEEADRMRALFEDAVKTQSEFYDVEAKASTASAAEVWLSLSAVPILEGPGRLVGFRGTAGDVTDRKRAEEILRASEERYRNLVESQRDLVVRWDADLRLTYANEAYCRFYGHDRSTVVGRPILDFVANGRRAEIRALIELLSTPPYRIPREERVRQKDGDHWLSWEAYPICDPAGRILEVQGSARDVTEAHRAAEALSRRDRILEAVNAAAALFLEASDWGTAVDEVMARLGRASGAIRVSLDERRSSSDGKTGCECRHFWDRRLEESLDADIHAEPIMLAGPGLEQRRKAFCADRLLQITIDEADEPLRSAMRSVGSASMTIVPIQVEGECWGKMILHQDRAPADWSPLEVEALRTACNIMGALIGRQRVEISLRASEDKYRTLVEGATQPITMFDRAGVVRFANTFAARSLGLEPEQVVGKSIWDLFPREYADLFADGIALALTEGKTVIRRRQATVQGRKCWYETRIQPLREAWEGHQVALLIATDITERKEAEARILSYQRRLRTLSSELVLTEQRERRRIAVELHDRIGQSLAMARIKLASLRALEDPSGLTPPALADAVQLIDQSIQDARTLTFDLSPPILYELGLDPALEWLLERFQERHALQSKLDSDQKPTPLSPDALGLIFESAHELLMNVVKHANARSVTVRVRRQARTLRLEVSDDGAGFDVRRSSRRGSMSAGFGLFTVRERMAHLGGLLSLDSHPGRGTRAVLQLPFESRRRRRPHGKEEAVL